MKIKKLVRGQRAMDGAGVRLVRVLGRSDAPALVVFVPALNFKIIPVFIG